MAATVVLAGTAGASAAPGTGSSGSSGTGSSGGSVDTGSVDTGSAGGGSSEGGPAAPPPSVQQCNQSTKSGGAGVTTTVHQLGKSGPASFVLRYETLNIPDQIEVFYEGNRVYNTGYVGDNTNEGTGSAVINLPPGSATSVTVRVTGPNDTQWDYTVRCPHA